MANWTTPKINWTSDDYENVDDFNRQKSNIEYIAKTLLPSLGMNPEHQQIDDVDMNTLPLPSLLNKMEVNIKNIGTEIANLYGWTEISEQPEVVWVGNNDAPDYTDMNRWENNMLLVKNWAEPIPKRFKQSGTFVAGQINILPRRVT
jgi:hypothetical protein